jgi:hypothetical protein
MKLNDLNLTTGSYDAVLVSFLRRTFGEPGLNYQARSRRSVARIRRVARTFVTLYPGWWS